MRQLRKEIGHLKVGKITVAEVDVVTALLLASGQVVDLNGEAYGLMLDADADTAIGASVDDVINIKVNGAEDIRILANILRLLSGTVLETDTINETTAAAGVTIDGVLIKDNMITAVRNDFVITATGSALSAADSGKTYLVTGADQTFTLPATVEGLEYTFSLAAAGLSAGAGLAISPNAADAIHGAGLTSIDDKDLILAGSGDAEGDTVTIRADGVDGWYITSIFGTWSKQA